MRASFRDCRRVTLFDCAAAKHPQSVPIPDMSDDSILDEAPVAALVSPDDAPAGGSQASLFVDYQSLHHYLKGRTDGGSTADLAGLLFTALRTHLEETGDRIVRGRAYADFGALDDHARHVQRLLYLHGIEPVFVPATTHRNTTDLQLAVDVVQACHAHPEAGLFVLVAGDRDYVPVVQALIAAGRRVVVVGFREHLSPHLLEHTRGGHFVDAATLLPTGALAAEPEVGAPVSVTVFQDPQDPQHEIDYDALEVIERNFGHYDEIYLTPLLRRLSEEIGDRENHDPKSLVADLEECGAVRLERRRGMPYDYTVLIVNAEHPAVVEVREEIHGTAGDTDDGLPFEDEVTI